MFVMSLYLLLQGSVDCCGVEYLNIAEYIFLAVSWSDVWVFKMLNLWFSYLCVCVCVCEMYIDKSATVLLFQLFNK